MLPLCRPGAEVRHPAGHPAVRRQDWTHSEWAGLSAMLFPALGQASFRSHQSARRRRTKQILQTLATGQVHDSLQGMSAPSAPSSCPQGHLDFSLGSVDPEALAQPTSPAWVSLLPSASLSSSPIGLPALSHTLA